MSAHTYKEVPTIKKQPFDASADALALRKAMKGFGTNEDAIINILAKRTDSQRQEIIQKFKQAFDRDLRKDLKGEISGKLWDTVSALMRPRAEYLALQIKKCIGSLFMHRVLVDILFTASNEEIRKTRAAFKQMYNVDLELIIKECINERFNRLLVTLCKAKRQEDAEVNPELAVEDARALSNADKSQIGTDQDKFMKILCARSYPQLRLMFSEYRQITGQSIEKSIEKKYAKEETNQLGLLAIVKCARNRAAFFARRLRECVEGVGTWDNDLIRIVVSRAEVDLENIKKEYEAMYGKTLAKDISGDTSGDYRKILLTLVAGNK